MAKKLKIEYIILAGIGGFAALVAVDHYVLKGRLGISGAINMLIGKLKFGTGLQNAPPIEPAALQEGGLPPQTATPESEQSLMEA